MIPSWLFVSTAKSLHDFDVRTQMVLKDSKIIKFGFEKNLWPFIYRVIIGVYVE
jgi:hypothetical protein